MADSVGVVFVVAVIIVVVSVAFVVVVDRVGALFVGSGTAELMSSSTISSVFEEAVVVAVVVFAVVAVFIGVIAAVSATALAVEDTGELVESEAVGATVVVVVVLADSCIVLVVDTKSWSLLCCPSLSSLLEAQ